MDELIQISKINDFIFCPYSIYFHSIYSSFKQDIYHEKSQVRGRIKHENIDKNNYSTASRYLQGIPIYCEKYQIIGKIDIYDKEKKVLIERKYKVKKIYDGYKYQLYAQYFGMLEKGYKVKGLFIHSLSDNKRYDIPIPEGEEFNNFESLIKSIWEFDINKEIDGFSEKKCQNCIYRNLCDKAKC